MRSDPKNRSASSIRASPATTKRLNNVEDSATPCSSSSRKSCFKENVNINKSDTGKLSAEPLPMKRKKKGGGYDLRKSLAWDRAFFVEEGVLDPIELSTISGTSCGERLFTIDEEITSTPSYNKKTAGVPAIENDLIKESPRGALGNYRKSDCLSLKPDSRPNAVISTSMTSQKSSHPSSKIGSSRVDTTRPLSLSGSKRSANATVAKSACNELKLLKVPVAKSVSRANYLKHNQVTEPVVGILRNIGSNRSSKSQKNTEDTSKASTLRPSRHSKGNSENTLQKGHILITGSPLLVDKADDSGSKIVSDNMVPFSKGKSFQSQYHPTTIPVSIAQNALISGGHMPPSPNQARPSGLRMPLPSSSFLSQSQDQPTTIPVSITQNALISGGHMHPSSNQARPSGLRMPSPSLSFFSQPKTSVPHSLSWRNADLNVLGIQKLDDLRSYNTLTKTPTKVNGMEASTSNSNRIMRSTSECSAPFKVNAVSLGIVESNMEENSKQKVEMKDLFDVNSSEPKGNTIDVNGQNQNVLKQFDYEKMRSGEDKEFGTNDKELSLQSMSSEKDTYILRSTILDFPGNRESCMSGWGNSNLVSKHDCLMLGNSGSETKGAMDEVRKGQNIHKHSVLNHDISSQTQPGDVNHTRRQNSLTVGSKLVKTCMHNCHELLLEKTDQLKVSLEETDQGPTGDNDILERNGRAYEPAKESQGYGTWYAGNADYETLESNIKVPGSTSNNEHKDLSVEAASKDFRMDNLHVGQAEQQAPEDLLTTQSFTNNIDHMLGVCDSKKQSGEASELQDVRREVEVDMHNSKLQTSDCLLPEKQARCTESLQEEPSKTLQVVAMAGENGNHFFDINMESTEAAAALQDDDLNIDKVMKQPLFKDTQLNSIENIQSSERHSTLVDVTSSNDDFITSEANVSPNDVAKLLVGGDGRLLDYNNMWNMGTNELKADKQSANSPDQETVTPEMNCSSLFSTSMVSEGSQQISRENTEESWPILDGYHGKNSRTSALIVKKGGFGEDEESTVPHTGVLMVQSNAKALKECCFEQTSPVHSHCICNEQSAHLQFPNPEGLICCDDKLPLKNCSLSVNSTVSNEADQTSVLDCLVDSVTKRDDLHGGEIRSTVNVEKQTLVHKICKGEYEIVGQSGTHDHDKLEGSEESNTFVSEESIEDNNTISSINKSDDCFKKKSNTFILPQNAVPFSDEWLAAIEAAGEDILTLKSGAVQHSPTDKSLPEPNPWSPVKRKTNNVGPFDCTKFTNMLPSDSS